MIITNKFNVHLDCFTFIPVMYAMQCDSNTRVLQFSLYNRGDIYLIPDGVSASVSYKKTDGTGGFYDTLPDGTTPACEIDKSVVRAIMSEQVLACPGHTQVTVSLKQNDCVLAAFPVIIEVLPNPGVGAAKSVDYFSLAAAINAAEKAAGKPSLTLTVIEDGGKYRLKEGYTATDLDRVFNAGKIMYCIVQAAGITAYLTEFEPSHRYIFTAVIGNKEHRISITDTGVDYTITPLAGTSSGFCEKLTFTGAVEAEYDGLAPVTVEIPTGGSNVHVGSQEPEDENVTLWIDPDQGDPADFISCPDKAEAGNVLAVKTVDTDGKPVQWETVEMPIGGGSGVHVGTEEPENENVNLWIDPEQGNAPDFIPCPEQGEEGQVLAVKAVDADGKPTEWEAINLPSGDSSVGAECWTPVLDMAVSEETYLVRHAVSSFSEYLVFIRAIPGSGTNKSPITIDVYTGSTGGSVERYQVNDAVWNDGKTAIVTQAHFMKPTGANWIYGTVMRKEGATSNGKYAFNYSEGDIQRIDIYTSSDNNVFGIGTQVQIFGR